MPTSRFHESLRPAASASKAGRHDRLRSAQAGIADQQDADRETRTPISVEPGVRAEVSLFRTVLSTLQRYTKRGGTNGRKREGGPLKRVKDTLLMALGQDDDDDYECGRG